MQNNTIFKSLLELGLSDIAAQVYQCYLIDQDTSISDLSRKITVYRQKIYDAITELGQKGLIKNSKIIPPSEVLALLVQKNIDSQRKTDSFREVLPEMLKYYYAKEKESFSLVYEGKSEYLKLFYKFIEETNGEMYIWGDMKTFIELVSWELNRKWIDIRIVKKVGIKMLTFQNEYMKQLEPTNSDEIRQIKYLDQKYNSEAVIWINQNSIVIWNPIIPRATLIYDPIMTKFFVSMFNMFWDILD
jgi:sugar-specific transcriptional regulator TrmB